MKKVRLRMKEEDKIKVKSYYINNKKDQTQIKIKLIFENKMIEKIGIGNGPIEAFINILKEMKFNIEFKNYTQQSSNDNNEKSYAITYINMVIDGKNIWSIGKDADVTIR